MRLRILLAMANLRATGALTMGLGLVEGFKKLATDDEYFVLHPEGLGYEKLMSKDKWHSIPVSSSWGALKYKLQLEQITIPRLVRENKIDVLLSCNSIGTWNPGCSHVVLVHLPHLAYHLKELDFCKPLRFRARYYLRMLYFRMTIKHIQAVIVQTPVMQKRMIERWGFSSKQLYVIPPASTPLSISDNNFSYELPEQLKSGRKTKPYVCYVAGPIPHKNFEILPKTWAYLVEKGFDCNLVLTVDPSNTMLQRVIAEANRLGVAERFICLGNVPHRQALELLQNSFCLIMPTLLETVGLPYIEAMHCRCPIVSSDRDFAHSVCGQAAVYFNPKDYISIGNAILKIHDEKLRNRLIDAGQKQLRENFPLSSWTEVARSYRAVLKQVTGS